LVTGAFQILDPTDFFSFNANVGDRIVAIVNQDPDGDGVFTWTTVTIHDTAGVATAASNLSFGNANASGVYTALASGTHAVSLTGFAGSPDNDYSVVVIVEPAANVLEAEPNDSIFTFEKDFNGLGVTHSGTITSPMIDLTTVGPDTTVSLSFNYFLETEGLAPSFDVAVVNVSNGATTTVASNSTNLADPSLGWNSISVDISAFIGQTIEIEFLFDTVDPILNAFEGWLIDDVAVTATATLSAPVIKGQMLWLRVFDDPNQPGDLAVYSVDIASNDVFDAAATPFPDSVLVVDRDAVFGGEVLRFDQAGNVIQTIDHPIFDTGIISDVEIGPTGHIFVALDINGDGGDGALVEFNAAGTFLGVIPLAPDAFGVFFHPFGFDVAPDGSFWVARPNSGIVAHLDANGNEIQTFPVGGTPEDVAFNTNDGKIYIADGGGGGVKVLDPVNGNVNVLVAGGSRVGINFNADGDFWVSNRTAGQAELYTSAGNLLATVPTTGSDPFDPEEDRFGNLWVTDFNATTVEKYNETSPNAFTIQFAAPDPDVPIGLAVVPPGRNDTIDTATNLGMVIHEVLEELTLPWGDEDWFKITAWANQGAISVSMDLVDTDMDGVLDPEETLILELYDMDGNLIAVGQTDPANFRVNITGIPAEKNEMFFIRVVGDPVAMSQNEYSLNIVNDDQFDIPRSGLYVVDTVTTPVGSIDNIYEIDPDDGAVLRTLPVPESVGSDNVGLAFDGEFLYYIDSDGASPINALDDDAIYVLDPSDGSVVNIYGAPIGSELDALAADPDAGLLYAADFGTNTVYRIVAATGAVLSSFVVPADIEGGLAFNTTVAAATGNLFASLANGNIVRINADTGAIVTTLITPAAVDEPLGLALLGGRLFAANNDDATVYELNPATGAILNSFASPAGSPTAADAGPEDLVDRNDTPETRTDLGMNVHISQTELTVPWGDVDYFKFTAWADGTVDLRITLMDTNHNGQIDPEELLEIELFADGVPGDASDDDGMLDDSVATGTLQGFDLVIAHVPAVKNEMFLLRVGGATTVGPQNNTALVVFRDNVPGSPQPGFDPGGEVRRYDQAGNVIQVIDHPIFDDGVISDVEVGPNDHIYVAQDLSFDGIGGQGQLIEFDANGVIVGVVPLPPDTLPALGDPAFFFDFGFDVAPDGTFWVARQNSNTVVHVDLMGNVIETYNVAARPVDVAFDEAANRVYVGYHVDDPPVNGASRVDEFDPSDGADGNPLTVASPTLTTIVPAANLDGAFGINLNAAGNFWVSDHIGVQIEEYDPGNPVAAAQLRPGRRRAPHRSGRRPDRQRVDDLLEHGQLPQCGDDDARAAQVRFVRGHGVQPDVYAGRRFPGGPGDRDPLDYGRQRVRSIDLEQRPPGA
jgi:streptogramin lyase